MGQNEDYSPGDNTSLSSEKLLQRGKGEGHCIYDFGKEGHGIGHGTTVWFQIGKGVHQGCILSPRLLNLYAEYIMKNARLDEAQTGIKTARRNISNLRCALATTLMAESEE